MKIIIYGASGMVGRGVLLQSLKASDVEKVVIVVRKSLGIQHDKLIEIISSDLNQTEYLEPIQNFDACFYCLGISAAGLTEVQYQAVNYDLTIHVANALVPSNPNMTFVYISGAGTDSTEQGKIMWARVKGKTENTLQDIPFKSVYSFRPAVIQPLDGIESQTTSYRIFYKLAKPFFPIIQYFMPNAILTTQSLGNAMLNAARIGYNKPILEVKDIIQLSKAVS